MLSANIRVCVHVQCVYGLNYYYFFFITLAFFAANTQLLYSLSKSDVLSVHGAHALNA